MSQKVLQICFGDGYAGSAKMAILSSELLQKRGFEVIFLASQNSLTEKRALDKVIKDQDALIKQQTEVVKKLENMKKVRDSLVKGALSTFKWGTVIGGSIFGASKAYDILK